LRDVLSRKDIPVALTIAGSDSGGGAGIQADLKTFAALGVHGTSVLTCITAQNPRRVLATEACSAQIVKRQLEALFGELPPRALKTGMLYSAPIVRVVADTLKRQRACPFIVDPVMISTSGARLLKPDAMKLLMNQLLPLATLVTPNLAEAEALLGARVRSVEEMRMAAKAIQERFGCAALVKGGHLQGTKQAVDILNIGREEFLLSAPFIGKVKTHGTGCTYSAAITAYLARGLSLMQSVQKAKEYITGAIAGSQKLGNYTVLNHFWMAKKH
jgi:hydroxymethylpyrimidine/phosphomethylpyrimidine kinase